MFSHLLRAVLGRLSVEDGLPSDAASGASAGLLDRPAVVSDHDVSSGPATHRVYAQLRHATADFTEADDDEDDDSNDGLRLHTTFRPVGSHEDQDEDGDPEPQVLPLFSASHLDSLPVYSFVHAIRILVQARTETTLTWEQLRSPQVSQFLIKPMQQQIRSQDFSRATLYALMANCLQFSKEGQYFPGNAGTSNTRAKVCELLAIRLLKEYSTRELIDALSYDFNPLQGLPGAVPTSRDASSTGLSRDARQQKLTNSARTSTLEVAIRASAKHFLAHPLVVQQLEAIWNGAISFYSSADTLHRDKVKRKPLSRSSHASSRPAPSSARHGANRGQGRHGAAADARTPLLGQLPLPPKLAKEEHVKAQRYPSPQPSIWRPSTPLYRRTVTLYDPRHASLFKLSRLRVPRYRQFLSTCSLAIMIGLFLAVLIQRSKHITTLELVFWFWSAGFMLDELVGFNEQGFSLYIMSFWNIFDLGILLLLIIYYSLRICGVFLADASQWNDNAYDILAANAILLLPRIFSVLDHYQYFSQLLIAFRLMAVDLAAVFILILVSCSGFFVFFTLSRNENDASDVIYKIFQILMGFTPAAWEVWPNYNFLGKSLLAFFLIICHFVVVTILITVLTNSFMAIASNANEEHQFLFAINTISMVKNDALFSYIAPTNIFAWMLMPLRYCMPLPHFVALNRMVIKITHFPLLFGIFIYEKFFLAPFMYEPTDLVENSSRARHRIISMADPGTRSVLFSPSIRLREESIAGFQKDRALDEVFRRTPDIATLRTQRRNERRKTQTAIRTWMDQNDGIEDSAHPFSKIDPRPDHEWRRRMSINRDRGSQRLRHFSEVRSAASDPADLLSLSAFPSFPRRDSDNVNTPSMLQGPFDAAFKDHTDAEGDDELVTNDEEEDTTTNTGERRTPLQTDLINPNHMTDDDEDGDFFSTPTASRYLNIAARSPESQVHVGGLQSEDDELDAVHHQGRLLPPMSPPKHSSSHRVLHSRAPSSSTILYNPPHPAYTEARKEEDFPAIKPLDAAFSPPSPKVSGHGKARAGHSRHTTPGTATPTATMGQRSPRRSIYQAARPRPILSTREHIAQAAATSRAAAVFNSASQLSTPVRRAQRRMSSIDLNAEVPSDLMSTVGPQLGEDAAFAAMPASFTSQLALATALNARASGETDRDRDRMSRLVLARMKTLEESFTDVVQELRALKQQQQQQPLQLSQPLQPVQQPETRTVIGHGQSVSNSDDDAETGRPNQKRPSSSGTPPITPLVEIASNRSQHSRIPVSGSGSIRMRGGGKRGKLPEGEEPGPWDLTESESGVSVRGKGKGVERSTIHEIRRGG